MKMTIEEAQKILSNGLANASSEYDWCVAFTMAIDTIRKYQKIEQILKEPCIIPEGCYPMLKRIKREVEDGNGD